VSVKLLDRAVNRQIHALKVDRVQHSLFLHEPLTNLRAEYLNVVRLIASELFNPGNRIRRNEEADGEAGTRISSSASESSSGPIFSL
jgi:hypothetical protein